MIHEQFGCPPDYNPGFCYEPTDDECTRCWRGWFRENGWQLDQARQIVKAYNSLKPPPSVCGFPDLTKERGDDE